MMWIQQLLQMMQSEYDPAHREKVGQSEIGINGIWKVLLKYGKSGRLPSYPTEDRQVNEASVFTYSLI